MSQHKHLRYEEKKIIKNVCIYLCACTLLHSGLGFMVQHTQLCVTLYKNKKDIVKLIKKRTLIIFGSQSVSLYKISVFTHTIFLLLQHSCRNSLLNQIHNFHKFINHHHHHHHYFTQIVDLYIYF